MLQLPESRPARASTPVDPIFDLIAAHKSLAATANEIYDQHQEAEFNAGEKLGHRPSALINWRHYDIGGGEIELRRKTLLEEGMDAELIETEYRDARTRYAAKITAGKAWDQRAGLTELRKRVDRTWAELRRSQKRLVKARPTTPGGAAALLQCILDDDLSDQKDYWHLPAIKNLVGALNAMSSGTVRR